MILKELRALNSHPTADELYGVLKQKLPRISLATVYRNLEMLSAEGIIRKLQFGGGQKRFDGNPVDHTHILCVSCGSVGDIVFISAEDPVAFVKDTCGYKVLDHRVEFRGLCPQCHEQS